MIFFQFFSSIEAGSILGLLEEEKKVFWINIYNALVQIELHEMTSEKVDKSIFSKKVIEIAGESMSLDNIEHGILRGNFWKYGLGFLPGGYLVLSHLSIFLLFFMKNGIR